MCGRYTLTVTLSDIESRFACPPSGLDWNSRYNIAPTQQTLAVVRADKVNHLKAMKWGLVPHWAKDPKMGSRLINARLETVDEKPAFKSSLQSRRCIIPADGYYEWQKKGRGKEPYRIVLETGDCFGFAGIWDTWVGPNAKIMESFSIITTEAENSIRAIHDRMPLILTPELEEVWLKGPENHSREAMKHFLALLHPRLLLRAYRVSPLVGSPVNDRPEYINEVVEFDD